LKRKQIQGSLAAFRMVKPQTQTQFSLKILYVFLAAVAFAASGILTIFPAFFENVVSCENRTKIQKLKETEVETTCGVGMNGHQIYSLCTLAMLVLFSVMVVVIISGERGSSANLLTNFKILGLAAFVRLPILKTRRAVLREDEENFEYVLTTQNLDRNSATTPSYKNSQSNGTRYASGSNSCGS